TLAHTTPPAPSPSLHLSSCFFLTPRPPPPPPFPYTTLFRSALALATAIRVLADPGAPGGAADGPFPALLPAAVGGTRLEGGAPRSEEHTSELQSLTNLVCRLLLEKKK